MNYADDLKVRAISGLLPGLEVDEIIGSEVRFGEGQRRADLVISSPTRLSAFEVKGPRDNLDKLSAQSDDYARAFLDYSVISAPGWIGAIRELVPRSTGLITIDSDHMEFIRQPSSRLRLTLDAGLQWLRTSDLRRLLKELKLNISGDYSTLSERVRKNITSKDLTKFTLNAVHSRLVPRFESFRNELGRTVTLDDVQMLTLNDRVTH